MNDKNGCGCLVTIFIIAFIIIGVWKSMHPDAGTFERVLFYWLIGTGVAFVGLCVYSFEKFATNNDNGGGNGGCLLAIGNFISAIFNRLNGNSSTNDISVSDLSIETDSSSNSNSDTYTDSITNSSSKSEDVNLGKIGRPTPKTSGATTQNNDTKSSSIDKKGENNNSASSVYTPNDRVTSNRPTKKILIEEKLYNKIKSSTNQLIDFCTNLAEDREFREYLAKVAKESGGYISSDALIIQALLFQLAMKDIFSCMDRMGCSVVSLSTMNYSVSSNSGSFTVRYDSLEGQVLLALMFINNNRFATYSDFKPVVMNAMIGRRSKDVDVAEADIYKYYSSSTNVSTDAVNDYQLPIVLRSVSRDDDSQKYKKILYSIASCFAYADGVLLQKEKSFLKELGKDAGVVDVGITVDGAPNASIEDLDALIGLKEVKESIRSLVNFIKVNQKRESMGLKVPSISYHCVFTGNPGTGKTTVARILAGIYKELGILKTGQLIETDRSGLVAEYVGQTAIKTNKIIDQAIGGVLFIDEAYSLVGGGNEDYGKEAISTLLKRMEDDRDKLVVILAGYSKEMETFINSNPGLRSRFSRYINFPDYSAKELFEIFKLNMKKFDYHLTKNAEDYLKATLVDRVDHKPSDFGNAREVRNLFEKVVEAQSDRLLNIENLTKEEMSELTLADIQKACRR